MRGIIRTVQLAPVASAAIALGLLVLALPAHAAASKHHPDGTASAAQSSPRPNRGIPINVQLGGLRVHVTVPLNLAILTGQSSSPPLPTSAPPNSAPPPASSPSHRPSRPSTPPPTQATHDRSAPQTQPSANLVAPRLQTPQQTGHARGPRHAANPRHTRTRAQHTATASGHHGNDATFLGTPPLHTNTVALLLGVVAVLAVGVAGIVFAGGRRGRSASKHRR